MNSSGDRQPTWNVLYRGPLSSCNYECAYCPFAKTSNTREELDADAHALARFVGWVALQHERRVGVLFTPWGEALIQRPYQEAIIELSHLSHVHRVAIQTNLSCRVGWLAHAELGTAALWTTFHPTQVPLHKFVDRCRELDDLGVRYSVGIVGLREHLDEMETLRSLLSSEVYLWVNAFKRRPDYYETEDLDRIRAIDPYFELNRHYHPSLGRACNAGHLSFTVDGDGQARRCHFVDEPLGSIHDPGFAARLEPRPCPRATCGCHVGYVHVPDLGLQQLFGDGLLERIPERWPVIEEHPLIPGR
ncbi:MAG: STM4011 family radical SAM protein [Acidobacteriota bacterium]